MGHSNCRWCRSTLQWLQALWRWVLITDMDETKKKKAVAHHQEIAKAYKWKKKEEDKAMKKEALMPSLKQNVDRGIDHMHSLRIKWMKDLLHYYFDVKGSAKMGKQVLKEVLTAATEEEHPNISCN